MSNRLFTLSRYAPRCVCDTDSPDTLSPAEGESSVIAVYNSSIDAYYRLLGWIEPKENLRRLLAFNRKVFDRKFREKVNTILLESDPLYYYRDPKDVKLALEPLIRGGNGGHLERKWETYSDTPNPHHLVPRSRGGTWSIKNIRGTDRHMHDDFHALFVNLTPVEQLRHICHMLSNAFTAEFLSDFMKVTTTGNNERIYVPESTDPERAKTWIVGAKSVKRALIVGPNAIHSKNAASKRNHWSHSRPPRTR
jgi:hypothetical protein